MALTIALEDERGEKRESIHDYDGALLNLVYKTTEDNPRCFRLVEFIDPYGDTVFNRLQMPQLNSELEQLLKVTTHPERQGLLLKIQGLVQQCQEGVHLYIKMYGD
jgi:hypothetical protein